MFRALVHLVRLALTHQKVPSNSAPPIRLSFGFSPPRDAPRWRRSSRHCWRQSGLSQHMSQRGIRPAGLRLGKISPPAAAGVRLGHPRAALRGCLKTGRAAGAVARARSPAPVVPVARQLRSLHLVHHVSSRYSSYSTSNNLTRWATGECMPSMIKSLTIKTCPDHGVFPCKA